MTGDSRPNVAGHDWPLYGDEYGRMKFGNVPIADSYVIYYDLSVHLIQHKTTHRA